MGILDKILAAPFKGIIDAIGSLIDKNSTTEEERLAARAQLAIIQLEADKAMAAADVQFAELQSRVIIAETQSESWMTANWRPLTMLSFVAVVLYTFIGGPLFGLKALTVPPDLWDVIKLGLTGYVVGRSAEKVLPDIVEVMKKDKK